MHVFISGMQISCILYQTYNNSKYFLVSSDITSLLLADAIDNVDDKMTVVCIEAIVFLNKAKKESNRNIFFNTPFTRDC